MTNYVMLELGQPMHAYDLGELDGGIVVRRAQPGEKLKLLDGREVDSRRNGNGDRRPREAAGARGRDGRRSLGHLVRDDRRAARGRVLPAGRRRRARAPLWPRHRRVAALRARRGSDACRSARSSGRRSCCSTARAACPDRSRSRNCATSCRALPRSDSAPSGRVCVIGAPVTDDEMATILQRLGMDVRRDGDALEA